MTRYVALLRGINVGGNRKVLMADLRALATGLALGEPRTILQSGNLVFASNRRRTEVLEQMLEREAERQLDVRTDFIVRSAREWEQAIARNPFSQEAERDPGHLLVMFMKTAVTKQAVDAVRAANPGPEIVHGHGRELYIVFPHGMGTSKLPALMTEARLGSRGTGRNWNTVRKLQAVLQD